MSDNLKCAECGATVTITDGEVTRTCEHTEAAIIADIKAVTYGKSSLEQ
jgi:Fe2+ or Zn2+ uptake regulation protein